MAKTPAKPQQGAGKGPATGGRVNVSAQAASLASRLNFGTPKKVAPQQQQSGKARGGVKSSNLFQKGRRKSSTAKSGIAPSSSGDPNFAANRRAIAAKLNFGASKRPPPPPPARPASKPGQRVVPKGRNIKAGKSPASNGSDFSKQQQALASKLSFRPPRPAEPTHQQNPPPPRPRPAPKPSNPVVSDARNARQVQPVVSEDVDFATQRAAIASKLTFGRQKGKTAPNRTPPPRQKPSNRAAAGGSSQKGKGTNADFAASSAALASKLNFRPPRPPSPSSRERGAPRTRAVTQTAKPVSNTTEEISGTVDMATHAASLASKLKFRPPRLTSPKTKESNSRQVRQPWAPEPVQERLGPNASNRIRPNHEARPILPAEAVPMDAHIVAITQKLHLRNEASSQGEKPFSPRDAPKPPTYYDSVERYDAPRQAVPEPEMQYVRSYSVSKLSPAEAEPELKYVRTYSISKQQTAPAPAPPTVEPFRQAIKSEPAMSQRTTVVLLDERYEWGTIPRKAENEDAGRGKKKNNRQKKGGNNKKVKTLSSKKKKKGCTIM